MSEFIFPCPQCGKDIQCDESYSGAQINCPICQSPIVVPQLSAPPTPAPMRPSAMIGSAGRTAYQPPPPKKSGAMRTTLIIAAIVIVCAALGGGGWYFYSKHKAKAEAAKGNPAAQVTAPTGAAAIQAVSILSKVHSAYTNMTSVRADATITLFLNLSNITVADVTPNRPTDAKNATRHPPGMPNVVTNTTELSVKQAQPDLYYIAGEAVSKVDRQTMTNTFAFWSSDKGKFMFTDSHQRGMSASYMQLARSNSPNSDPEQIKKMQQIFADPAQLTKIIKDLGQTDDESVNGQDCYTLTAKVLGQKVKIWVDKTSYLILQSQITLGGTITDADIDDAFALFISASTTNLPPAQLDMIKAQVKTMTPTMAKIRGTITSTSKNMEINPALSTDDFNYPVPSGVRLIPSRF
jgi:outer membrane lipoprotein-sorting protein